MIRSDLFDFSYAYIAVKGDIIVAKKYLLLLILRDHIIQFLMQLILIMQITMHLVKKKIVFKNNASFIITSQKLMV